MGQRSGAVKVTEDGGVQKSILRSGTGDLPNQAAQLLVHFKGLLADSGEQFISTRTNEEPFRLVLGKGQVVKGLELAVATMRQGEFAVVTCSPEYGYGQLGNPPRVPPNTALRFEVEYFGCEEIMPETLEEKKEMALKSKEEGNGLFKAENFKEAVKMYKKVQALDSLLKISQALQYIASCWGLSEELQKEVDSIRVTCYVNMAACQLKLKEYDEVVQNCTKALELEPQNSKALFRRGKAYNLRKEYLNAKADLLEAARLSQDKAIKQELEKVEKNIEESKKSRNIFGGLFNKMAEQNRRDAERERLLDIKEEQLASRIIERAKYIPMRLTAKERSYLAILEAGLAVSDYTGRVDILSYEPKTKRIFEQLQDMCGILSGLLIASDYAKGLELLSKRTYADNEEFFQTLFEIGRRHKIMNPDKMRTEYGKLIYLLQDSVMPEIVKQMECKCIKPLLTVYSFLESKGLLQLLEDKLIQVATEVLTSM